MSSSSPSNQRSLRLPVVFVLVVLTAIVAALVTLLVARIWIFQPEVAPVVLDSQEQAELEKKLQALTDKSQPYSESPKDRVIYLSERELNAIVARDPDLANRASFRLIDDKISATLLVDTPEDMPGIGGKTVEMSTGIIVGHADGRPTFIIEGVSLMDVPIPSAWLGGWKGRDLVQADGPGGGIWDIFSEGIKDLRVEDGRLRVELEE